MDMEQLLRLQREFDSKHGWNPTPDDTQAVFRTIQDDLIGIFGEIGEFANIIKKVALEAGHFKNADLATLLRDRQGDLAEELIDAFIYFMRLASHLNIKIEETYINKLNVNEHRFRKYENPPP
jgi:NTP pyrophosphatase (non-canonical NTP hydrolase)